MFNNFFLINIGGTNIPDTMKEEESIADFRPFDELEVRRETEKTIKNSYKFAKRSIVLSFIHHTVMLITIVLLVLWFGNGDDMDMAEYQQQNSTYVENFFLREVFKTKVYWQEMRSELYPYKIQESIICNPKNALDPSSFTPNGNLTLYSTALDACKYLETQLHLYDFLLIIGGVTLVGLFNLVLSIYSARDVKIRKTLDNISLQPATDDKESQTDHSHFWSKDEKTMAFDIAFSNSITKRNSLAHIPVRSVGSTIADDDFT